MPEMSVKKTFSMSDTVEVETRENQTNNKRMKKENTQITFPYAFSTALSIYVTDRKKQMHPALLFYFPHKLHNTSVYKPQCKSADDTACKYDEQHHTGKNVRYKSYHIKDDHIFLQTVELK